MVVKQIVDMKGVIYTAYNIHLVYVCVCYDNWWILNLCCVVLLKFEKSINICLNMEIAYIYYVVDEVSILLLYFIFLKYSKQRFG